MKEKVPLTAEMKAVKATMTHAKIFPRVTMEVRENYTDLIS
jgi:hypothetical protein